MHDIADLERRGVVGMFLASEVFAEAAQAQSTALGFPAAYVLVPHPVQDRTDEEMRAYAEQVLPAVLAAVTSSDEGQHG
ncbi:MAG: selenoprotein [Frankiales bacterium]|nr:selenoprotein [Frankiales bacterium]